MGRTVNVTRKVTMASVHAPRSLPRNSMCQNSRQLGIALQLPRGKDERAKVTSFARALKGRRPLSAIDQQRATYTSPEPAATTALLPAGVPPAKGSASLRAVHAKLLELAGERVAPPTKELGRFLAMALGALERGADENALELRQRFIEERALATHCLPVGPARQRLGPIGVHRIHNARRCELRGQILDVHFASRREHR